MVADHARVGFTYCVHWSKSLPLEANCTTGKRQLYKVAGTRSVARKEMRTTKQYCGEDSPLGLFLHRADLILCLDYVLQVSRAKPAP